MNGEGDAWVAIMTFDTMPAGSKSIGSMSWIFVQLGPLPETLHNIRDYVELDTVGAVVRFFVHPPALKCAHQ